MDLSPTYEQAQQLDQDDKLSHFREEFYIPHEEDGDDQVYLCGNSLGLQPKATWNLVERELKDWAIHGVEGHFKQKTPWLPYHEFMAEDLAAIVGAKPSEVVAMNSLTVNLHLLMVSFFRPQAKRTKILIEGGAFPSDQYAVKSQLRFHGLDPAEHLIELQPKTGENILNEADILQTIDQYADQIALVLLGGVNYLTGQAYPINEITKKAQACGALVGYDLAHAAGNLHLNLHADNVDFACWCSYKYLNSGPGGIAGAYIHERHHSNTQQPRFEGWWGHDKASRFQMGPDFKPIPSAEAWQLSNPPIFQLAALKASLNVFKKTTMPRLREKSILLTGYLELLLDELPGRETKILTPRDANQRGCQLSIRMTEDSKKIHTQLNENGFICDHRQPDVIRVAPVPLYNTFEDIYRFALFLKQERH